MSRADDGRAGVIQGGPVVVSPIDEERLHAGVDGGFVVNSGVADEENVGGREIDG